MTAPLARAALVVAALVVLAGPAFAKPLPSPGAAVWTASTGLYTGGEKVVVAPSGRVLVGSSGTLLGLDQNTGLGWSRSLAVAGSHFEFGDAEVSAAGGSVFVSGRTGYPTNDLIVRAYNTFTGSPQWTQTVLGNFRQIDMDLAVAGDGSRIFVTSVVSSDVTQVRALDPATGSVLWTTQIPAGWLNRVAASPDGTRVFVAPKDDTVPVHQRVVGLDAATGATLWDTFIGASKHYPTELLVSADGATVFGGFDSATAAVRASDGALLWYSEHGGDAVALSPDGATVYTYGDEDRTAAALVALDAANGNLRWASVPLLTNEINLANDVGVSPDGARVYTTGATGVWFLGEPEYDMLTGAFVAATGTPIWSVLQADTSWDEGTSLGVATDGRHVVATGFFGRVGTDTFAYAAS